MARSRTWSLIASNPAPRSAKAATTASQADNSTGCAASWTVMTSSQCRVMPSATASSFELKYRKNVARPTSAAAAMFCTVAPPSPYSETGRAAAVAIRSRVARRLRTLSVAGCDLCPPGVLASSPETPSQVRLCLTMSVDGEPRVPKTLEAWLFVQQVLGDVTQSVTADAETKRV